MKQKYFISICLGFMCCLLFAPVQTQAGTVTLIDDSYNGANTFWGGQVLYAGIKKDGNTGWGDVIQGARGEFDVDSMTVTQAGGSIKVRLQGSYFTNVNNSGSDVSKYGPGDLYISSGGWQVTDPGDPHYWNDVFKLNEGWNYVVSLDGSVYQLNPFAGFVNTGTNADTPGANIIKTNISPLNPGGYVYRTDQAWRGGYGTRLGDATVTYGADYLEFDFNTNVIHFSGTDFGLHWAARCGNEILEGSAPTPTPEPTTMLLLGLGVVGIAGMRKKFKG